MRTDDVTGGDRAGGPVVVREDDPQAQRLLAQGWTVGARSWGARLDLGGEPVEVLRARYLRLAQVPAGYQVRALTERDVPALVRLDALTLPDYPATPATTPQALTGEEARRRLAAGWLLVGAFAGDHLVAVSMTFPHGERWEVDRTAVLREHRRRGLATAVKAWSVVALLERGVRRLGTGGAASNAGSLAVNRALGFVLEPQWLTLYPPLYPPAGGPGGAARPDGSRECA